MKHLITLTALLLLSSLTSAQDIVSADTLNTETYTINNKDYIILPRQIPDTTSVWMMITYCDHCVMVQRKGYKIDPPTGWHTQWNNGTESIHFGKGGDGVIYLDSKYRPIKKHWKVWMATSRN